VGQTSGLPVAVPLAPQGVENFVRRQISVFFFFAQNENCWGYCERVQKVVVGNQGVLA